MDRYSTVDNLLWDLQRLAELKPTKANQSQIEMHKSNRRLHAALVRGMVFEHAFNVLLEFPCGECLEREASSGGY